MARLTKPWKVVRRVDGTRVLYHGDDKAKARSIFERAGKALTRGRVTLYLNGSVEDAYIGVKDTSPVLRRGLEAQRGHLRA